MRKAPWLVLVLVVMGCVLPALGAGNGENTWGPRLGVAVDPAVVMAGLHLDFGALAPDFHLRTLAEGGLGDDKTHLALGLQGLRFFDAGSKGWRPYLGGEVGVNYIHRDLSEKEKDAGKDQTTSGMALNLVGGFQGNLSAGREWFVELRGGFLKGPHAKLVLGWLF